MSTPDDIEVPHDFLTLPEAQRVSRLLQAIANVLDRILEKVAGRRVAWSLFVWTEGEANYIGAAKREAVIPPLKKIIERWEAGQPDVPFHQKH